MHVRTLLGCASLVAALFNAGTAYTASNQPLNGPAGSGAGAVSGVTAKSVDYTFNGADIEIVHLVLEGDTTDATIEVGFNDTPTVPCTGRGSYDGSTVTTYDCEIVHSIADATEFRLLAR